MNILKFLLNLIYPPQPQCVQCGQILKFSEIEGLCNKCLAEIEFLDKYCPLCGKKSDKCLCEYCKKENIYFDRVRAVGWYTGILRDLILNFKYEGKLPLKKPLSKLLYLYYNYYFKNLAINFILPIPLHQNRKKVRGFNQALLLTEKVKKDGIPVLKNYMIRKKDTPPLYNYSYSERENILKNIFKTKKKFDIAGSTVLIVDDIFTSGNTINQASYILKKQEKVKKVYALTLCISKNVKY